MIHGCLGEVSSKSDAAEQIPQTCRLQKTFAQILQPARRHLPQALSYGGRKRSEPPGQQTRCEGQSLFAPADLSSSRPFFIPCRRTGPSTSPSFRMPARIRLISGRSPWRAKIVITVSAAKGLSSSVSRSIDEYLPRCTGRPDSDLPRHPA